MEAGREPGLDFSSADLLKEVMAKSRNRITSSFELLINLKEIGSQCSWENGNLGENLIFVRVVRGLRIGSSLLKPLCFSKFSD